MYSLNFKNTLEKLTYFSSFQLGKIIIIFHLLLKKINSWFISSSPFILQIFLRFSKFTSLIESFHCPNKDNLNNSIIKLLQQLAIHGSINHRDSCFYDVADCILHEVFLTMSLLVICGIMNNHIFWKLICMKRFLFSENRNEFIEDTNIYYFLNSRNKYDPLFTSSFAEELF